MIKHISKTIASAIIAEILPVLVEKLNEIILKLTKDRLDRMDKLEDALNREIAKQKLNR